MREWKRIAAMVLLAVAVCVTAAMAQTGPSEKLLQEAKLMIFDKDWGRALDAVDAIIGKFPGTSQARQAMFYKGECLTNLAGREKDALAAYREYIKSPGAEQNMIESSEASIIDLEFDLLEKGDGLAAEEIESRLSSSNKAIRYYAAYKLSKAGDRSLATRAVPVLKRIIESEKDPELLDRARIALLRVSPESLKNVEGKRSTGEAGLMLSIRIWEKSSRDPTVSITIPWALADLAIRAIPDAEKASIRGKGYDLNRLLDDLTRTRDSLLRFEDEDSVIEIKIEKR